MVRQWWLEYFVPCIEDFSGSGHFKFVPKIDFEGLQKSANVGEKVGIHPLFAKIAPKCFNFYDFVHGQSQSTLDQMKIDQAKNQTRAEILISIDVSNTAFLFGAEICQLFDSNIIVIDHHESLLNYLRETLPIEVLAQEGLDRELTLEESESEIDQPEFCQLTDLDISRVKKIVMTPSTTCTTKFLIKLFETQYLEVYGDEKVKHFHEWTLNVDRGDTLSYRERNLSDFAFKIGFQNRVLLRKYQRFLRNTFEIVFGTNLSTYVESGKDTAQKDLNRVRMKIATTKSTFKVELEGQVYSGYYWLGYDWSMSWLTSELCLKAYHDRVGRIGIGIRYNEKKGSYKCLARLCKLQQGEEYLTELGDGPELSLAKLAAHFGGGGHKIAAGFQIVGKENLSKLGIYL